MNRVAYATLCLITAVAGPLASAAGGVNLSGTDSFGILAGVVNASQSDLNSIISNANTAAGGISTGQLNQAYEGALTYTHRFTGTMYAIQIRPSYFYEVERGTGSGGNYNFDVRGYTIFPILRVYPLENDFMHFFMQFGMGYGQMNGEINEGPGVVQFSANGFGTVLGMGADFCLSPTHCLTLEGDYRYLNYDRSLVSSASGTFVSSNITQTTVGRELEINGLDVDIRMSGLMFMAGYTFMF